MRARPSRLLRLLALAGLLLVASQPARADDPPPAVEIGPTDLGACPGDPISPSRIVEGRIPEALLGAYLMVPLEVPEGTTEVRVKYCFEDGSVVDLGLWEARDGSTPWGVDEFRGWGGSSHPDVAVSAQRFSSEAEFLDDRQGYVPGRTTRGFLPGPITPGEWGIELGVGAVNESADFRVEIALSSDPDFAAEPYQSAPYDDAPAVAAPGWYAGDLHVHAEHSSLNDATMRETFDFAFKPIDQEGAGLDFITLSDYVSRSAWGEIGRYQPDYPGKLVIRSAEVISYRGHANNHGSALYVDHRVGPLYEMAMDGSLTLLRAGLAPAENFARIQDAGGATQLNHVTTGPCRGCPWEYDAQETDFSRVDAVEVVSGSAFKVAIFTPSALVFWENALAQGHRIAAVGSSDSHQAGDVGDPPDALASPIGDGTTVVYAEELSSAGIIAGIRAGHTYVKALGNDGPDLRFVAAGDQGGSGIMGDALPDTSATLTATVSNLGPSDPPHQLKLIRNGQEVAEVEISPPGGEQEFRAETPGRYRIELWKTVPMVQLMALTSPIYVPEPGQAAVALAAAAALAALAGRRQDDRAT